MTRKTTMFKEYKIQKIKYSKYTDDGNEITERMIIPTFVPKPNIKAIDVTDLSKNQQETLRLMLKEYNKYVQERSKTIFSFNGWAEHTQQTYVGNLKYRTFKIANTDII